MKRNQNLKFKKGEKGKKFTAEENVRTKELAVHIKYTTWMLLVGEKKQKK